MKTKFAAITAMIMAMIITASFITCDALSGGVVKPDVSINEVRLLNASLSGANMKAFVKIQNDNSISISFPEIKWNLFVSEYDFIRGTIEKDTKIAANDSTIVEIPFFVNYTDLLQAVISLLFSSNASYRLDLEAHFTLPVLGKQVVPATFSGTIPLKPPFNSISENTTDNP